MVLAERNGGTLGRLVAYLSPCLTKGNHGAGWLKVSPSQACVVQEDLSPFLLVTIAALVGWVGLPWFGGR